MATLFETLWRKAEAGDEDAENQCNILIAKHEGYECLFDKNSAMWFVVPPDGLDYSGSYETEAEAWTGEIPNYMRYVDDAMLLTLPEKHYWLLQSPVAMWGNQFKWNVKMRNADADLVASTYAKTAARALVAAWWWTVKGEPIRD